MISVSSLKIITEEVCLNYKLCDFFFFGGNDVEAFYGDLWTDPSVAVLMF